VSNSSNTPPPRRSFLISLATTSPKPPKAEPEEESGQQSSADEGGAAADRYAPQQEPVGEEQVEEAPQPPSAMAVRPRSDAPVRTLPAEPALSPESLREQIARLTLRTLYNAEAPLTQEEINDYFNAWKKRPDNDEEFLFQLCEHRKFTDEEIQEFIPKMAIKRQIMPECEFASDIRPDSDSLARVAPAHVAVVREQKCIVLSHAEDGKIMVIGSWNPAAAFLVAQTLAAMPLASGDYPFVSAMRIPKAAHAKALNW
jgi:hypothetical protein